MSDSGKPPQDKAINPPSPRGSVRAEGTGSVAIGGNVVNSTIQVALQKPAGKRAPDYAGAGVASPYKTMKENYRAVILGKERGVFGYDNDGNLILADGERFGITPLDFDPAAFRSLTLRAVSRLTFTGGEWLLDEKPLDNHWQRQFKVRRSSERDTLIYTYWTLRSILSEVRLDYQNAKYPSPTELREKVSAVAWVNERFDNYAGQERKPNERPRQVEFHGEIIDMVTEEFPDSKAFEPIFLSSFYCIQSEIEAWVKPIPPKRKGKLRPPRKPALKLTSTATPAHRRFRVALSFPGERRGFVSKVAAILVRELGREVIFYDAWHEAELARPDLDLYLGDLYRKQADLVVPFYCADYERKKWCRLEWRQMREILFNLEGHRIMPFRFDNSPISGVLSLDGYIKIGTRSPKQVANLILERLSQPLPGAVRQPPDSTAPPECRADQD